MQVTLEMRDVNKVKNNIEALEWAIKHCPAAHLACLVDAKAIYTHIYRNHTAEGREEKRREEYLQMRHAMHADKGSACGKDTQ